MTSPLTKIQHAAVNTAVPHPVPTTMYQAAAGKPLEHLPYASWEDRAVARFTYPNGDAPDGARPYNASPVWAFGDEVRTGTNGLDWKYYEAGTDFDKALAFAHSLSTERDSYGDYANGAQAILQARNGTYYVSSLEGWGDEVPVHPGDPGGPAGPYALEEVANAGGVVTRYTPALKAVIGPSVWTDFRSGDHALRSGDLG